MFSHVMVGSNDIERSKRFYDALFAQEAFKDDKGRLFYRKDGSVFMVSKPIDGQPACPANGGTVGFKFDSPEDVDAWQRVGAESGGTPAEDPPGFRQLQTGRFYVAYMRDPDGNKLCALHRPLE